MWFLTVFGLMCSSAAIIALSLPFAISFSTWSSRSESSDWISSASWCDALGRADALQHLRRDRRRDERLADRRRPDALHQLGDRRVLQEVAARAGEDRVHHVAVLIRDRQHEHARQRRDHRDLAGRLDAADARHVEIHHDDVGRELADGVERVGAVRRTRRRPARPAPRAGCGAPSETGRGRPRAERAGRSAAVFVGVAQAWASWAIVADGVLGASLAQDDRDVRRPQAFAWAVVGNQRSIVAPTTDAAGVGGDRLAVARDRSCACRAGSPTGRPRRRPSRPGGRSRSLPGSE